jgi:hypothetical protein
VGQAQDADEGQIELEERHHVGTGESPVSTMAVIRKVERGRFETRIITSARITPASEQ